MDNSANAYDGYLSGYFIDIFLLICSLNIAEDFAGSLEAISWHALLQHAHVSSPALR